MSKTEGVRRERQSEICRVSRERVQVEEREAERRVPPPANYWAYRALLFFVGANRPNWQ